MAFYYFFDHKQRERIIFKDGLSVYSSIYADGQISAPIYNKLTNKFDVSYNIDKKDKIVEKVASFNDRGSALQFYLTKYREYQYVWSLMFYDYFKPKAKEKKLDNENVGDILQRIQNLQNCRCPQKRVLQR